MKHIGFSLPKENKITKSDKHSMSMNMRLTLTIKTMLHHARIAWIYIKIQGDRTRCLKQHIIFVEISDWSLQLNFLILQSKNAMIRVWKQSEYVQPLFYDTTHTGRHILSAFCGAAILPGAAEMLLTSCSSVADTDFCSSASDEITC